MKRLTEGKLRQMIMEAIEEYNTGNYTHFAVNKETNLIVNGWDYSDVDSSELKDFKDDYFYVDLRDNGFNPRAFKIISAKAAARQGATQWSNTGAYPIDEENAMQSKGINPFEKAHEEHPNWYIG